MKKIFLLLAIFTSIIACKKDDENKMLTPEEQSKVDDDKIIEYMKSYKFEYLHVGKLPRNIDWKLIPVEDDDPEGTQTLYDLMKDNVITTTFDGVDYKMYYYLEDEGKGDAVSNTDNVVVDYNVFYLHGYKMSERIDFTELSVAKFDISKLIEGWKLGLEKFKSGLKPDGFPQTPTNSDYRKGVDTPGRGILLVPSGLAYRSGVLRFDVVVYDNEAVEE
jgi:hypothetical protein